MQYFSIIKIQVQSQCQLEDKRQLSTVLSETQRNLSEAERKILSLENEIEELRKIRAEEVSKKMLEIDLFFLYSLNEDWNMESNFITLSNNRHYFYMICCGFNKLILWIILHVQYEFKKL